MGSNAKAARGGDEQMALDPPGYAQYLGALVGVVLLFGPVVAVLWPR